MIGFLTHGRDDEYDLIASTATTSNVIGNLANAFCIGY